MAKKSQETIIKERIKEFINQGVLEGRRSVADNIAYDFKREKYYVNFHYGSVNGKRYKQTQTFETAKEAVEALNQFVADRQLENVVLPNTQTFGEYCDIWLEKYCKPTPSTKKFYKNIIDVHVKPSEMGRKKLQSITSADVNEFIRGQRTRSDKELSPATLRHHRTALITIFGQAVEDDLLKINPALKSKPIDVKKKLVESFSLEEIQRIIKLSKEEPEPYCYIYPLAVYTGMSRGEICGLKWKRVDLKNGLIVVAEARTDETHGTETTDVKTANRLRAVNVTEDITTLLLEIKKRQSENKASFGAAYEETDFVMTYADGSIPYPRTVSKNFQWFLEKNQIRVLPFHDLRHTFGTFQRILGASSYDIKELMGHSSITVAENSYITGFAKNMEPQMKKLQDYLNSGPEAPDKG